MRIENLVLEPKEYTRNSTLLPLFPISASNRPNKFVQLFQCQRSQLKVLIACSTIDPIHTKGPDGGGHNTHNDNVPDGRPEKTKSTANAASNTDTQKIIFIVVLTILPLIALLLIGLFLLFRYQRSEFDHYLVIVLVNRNKTFADLDKTSTTTSSGSIGSNSEKSEVKVLFKREGWEKEV